jgi:hypothetical protein
VVPAGIARVNPSRSRTAGSRSAAQSAIAANVAAPASTALTATASRLANRYRTPRRSRGSGTAVNACSRLRWSPSPRSRRSMSAGRLERRVVISEDGISRCGLLFGVVLSQQLHDHRGGHTCLTPPLDPCTIVLIAAGQSHRSPTTQWPWYLIVLMWHGQRRERRLPFPWSYEPSGVGATPKPSPNAVTQTAAQPRSVSGRPPPIFHARHGRHDRVIGGLAARSTAAFAPTIGWRPSDDRLCKESKQLNMAP